MVLSRLLLGEWVKVGRRSSTGDLGFVVEAGVELELELVRERPRGLDGRPYSLLLLLEKAGSLETLTGKRKVEARRRWVGLEEASGTAGASLRRTRPSGPRGVWKTCCCRGRSRTFSVEEEDPLLVVRW